MADTRVLEQGDLFVFSAPNEEVNTVSRLDDIRMIYLAMAAEGGPFRLFSLMENSLPEFALGSTRWLRVEYTGDGVEPIKERLAGEQPLLGEVYPPAWPVGSASYQFVQHGDDSLLAYRLHAPAHLGPVQSLLNMASQAAYTMRIRNPHGSAPGYPGVSQHADYPSEMDAIINGKDWADASDLRFLYYVHTEVQLSEARYKRLEEALDRNLPACSADEAMRRLYQRLQLDIHHFPDGILRTGEWSAQRRAA